MFRTRLLAIVLTVFAPAAALRADEAKPKTLLPPHAQRRLAPGDSPSPVDAVTLAPSGKVLASAGHDGKIYLWDPLTGKQQAALSAHEGGVRALAFSPDGTRLASGGKDGILRMWDVAKATELWKIEPHPGETLGIAFAPDGKIIATSGAEKTIRSWRVSDGKEQIAFYGLRQPAFAVAFSPDGKLLAAGGRDRTTAVWDTNTGKILRQHKGHKSWVLALAFNGDGPTLISASRDQTIRLWDEWNGKTFLRLGGWDGEVHALALARKGTLLASGDANGIVRFRDARSGKEIAHWAGHGETVTSLAASTDSRLLVSGSADGSVLVWDLTAVAEIKDKTAPLEAADLGKLWADLIGDDEEPETYLAMRRLLAAPAQSLPMLRKNVVPVPADAHAQVVAFLKQLDNDDFTKREAAQAELLKRGQFTVPAIEAALKGELSSLEVRRRMARILEKLPVEQLARERERERRALEVLERMATPEARQLLQELAKGAPGVALTTEAAVTLERMDKRKKK